MFAFQPEVRKVIYPTNMIESINYQLRKNTKTRGHFPTDDALIKPLPAQTMLHVRAARQEVLKSARWSDSRTLGYLTSEQ